VASVKRAIAAAARRSGVPCSPHVFRHTAAVWMAEADVPMEQDRSVSRPHVDPRHVCATYARFSPRFMVHGEILRGSASGKAKLSEADVAYIRANPDNLSGRNLATRFKVSAATVSLIRNGRRWRHFDQPEHWGAVA
jgi:hypothetical protein